MVVRSVVRQRGAIGLMAAITLGMALLFMLLVVDSGRLYLEQRKLQRIADMAALEALNGGGSCVAGVADANALARRAALRNGHADSPDRTLLVECGSVKAAANGIRAFTVDPQQTQAIRVTATHQVATSIAAGVWALADGNGLQSKTRLQAQATAGRTGPALARLSIRSSLLTINTAKSDQLNTLLGALLGTQINLGVAQWQGLLDADLNLLRFLDALAIEAKVAAGNYTELLHKTLKVGDVLDVMAEVAAQDNPLVNVSGLVDLAVAGKDAGGIVLGELLNIQNGGTHAGLDATLQVLQLVQGTIQLANSKHAVETTLPVSVLGLANITTRLKIIEPPQFSALGDPSLAQTNPMAAGQIYVRTAQTRILIQVNLGPLLGGLNLGIIQLVPSPSLDVGLEVASASSHVRGYDCSSASSKRLRVKNDGAAAKVMIGTIDNSKFFSNQPVSASPLVLLRVPLLGLDVGLGANSPVFSQAETYDYLKPPNIDQSPPASRTMDTKNIVASLGATLGGLELSPQIPLVSALLNIITGLIGGLLGSLLDPLVNNLLALLGIDLNAVTIDAHLSCQSGRPELLI